MELVFPKTLREMLLRNTFIDKEVCTTVIAKVQNQDKNLVIQKCSYIRPFGKKTLYIYTHTHTPLYTYTIYLYTHNPYEISNEQLECSIMNGKVRRYMTNCIHRRISNPIL